ncbi:MAG: helix-turn-helix domain-containing protein [Mycobacteriales bacterium]
MSALARDADITTSSVSLYFSGMMMPSYATLVAMVVKGFGISMQRFYGPLPQQPRAAA